MKVIDVNNLVATEREVRCPKGEFISLRPILAKDGMGFSVHKTIIPKGTIGHWHYKHHLEACYCIEGGGIILNLETREMFEVYPDVIYALDKHDDHQFYAAEDTVLISIFNPPVTGEEVHREDGSYEGGLENE